MSSHKIIFSVLLFYFFLLGCKEEPLEKISFIGNCEGNVVTDTLLGVRVALDINLQENCFVSELTHPYFVQRKDDSIFFKIAPPTHKIESDQCGSGCALFMSPKIDPELRNLKTISDDTILLPWLGLKSDTISLPSKKIKFAPFLDFYFPKGASFVPFIGLNKGNNLIIDFPCVDAQHAQARSPFHITRNRYPFLRCIIAPAQRDYFGE